MVVINEKLTTIRVTKDMTKRLKLVSKLRGNKETQASLIGNLLDAEIARLGYKYTGIVHGTK